MSKRVLISIILWFGVWLNAFAQNQTKVSYSIYYSTNTATLSSKQINGLKIFVKALKSFDTIEIKSFADSTNTDTYNQELSLRRAKYAKKALLESGIDEALIQLQAFGESQPLPESTSGEEFAKNRRTDIIFILTEKDCGCPNKDRTKLTAKNTITDTTTYNNVFEALSSFISLKEEQTFKVSNNNDTTIVTKKGSIIDIPYRAFNTTSTSPINIKITEFRSKSEMILGDLSTTSNGQLLESGGMMSITAIQEGDTISLNQEIGLRIPTFNKRSDMQLFYGNRDNSGHLNWHLHEEDTGKIYKAFKSYIDRDEASRRRARFAEGTGGDPQSAYCDSLIALQGFDFPPKKQGFFGRLISTQKRKDELEDIQLTYEERQDCLKSYQAYKQFLESDAGKLSLKIKEKSKEGWMKEFEETLGNKDKKDAPNFTEVQYYVFSTRQLGNINIDRFQKIEGEKIDLIVKTENTPDNMTNVKAIFKDITSIVTGRRTKVGFIFEGIPANTAITLLGLKYENGKAMLYMEDLISSSKKTKYKVDFEEVNGKELKAKLKTLDQNIM